MESQGIATPGGGRKTHLQGGAAVGAAARSTRQQELTVTARGGLGTPTRFPAPPGGKHDPYALSKQCLGRAGRLGPNCSVVCHSA
jgi:hypothetical protein